MKHNKFFHFLLFCFCSLSACKKGFLDVENTSDFFRESYVKDLNTMEQFKNGIYIMLNFDYEKAIGSAYPELVADNMKPLSSGTLSLMAHYTWAQLPTERQATAERESSTEMNGVWMIAYRIIRACNFVVEDIDKYKTENTSKADEIKGEALAIRAMVHFKLLNIFAQCYKYSADASHLGIPYITTSDIAAPYKRQTVAEVYEAMISDFNAAVALLPASIVDTRFMNKAAAKALLARIYLFKEDFTNAKALATEICNQFPLMTIASGYPDALFKNKAPNESEILYRLTPVVAPQFGISSSFLGNVLRGSTMRYRATDDIAILLKENSSDIRGNWITGSSGLWNIIKYPTAATPEFPEVTNAGTAYYHPVIRSSEMFLTAAEAAAKTSDENTARTFLNAIRKRADPNIADITATGQALIDSIYKERRKELAFEGLRMYDLQRWKIGVHRTDAISSAPKDLPFPSDKSVAPIHLLDVRQAGLQQNPGY